MKTRFIITCIAVSCWFTCFPQTGGRVEMNVNSPEAIDAARKATEKINQTSNSTYYSVYVKINKAEKQIVSGTLYYLDLELMETTCKKSNVTGQSVAQIMGSCPLNQAATKECLKITIWHKPWLTGDDATTVTALQSVPCN